jgi:hypothetical protein
VSRREKDTFEFTPPDVSRVVAHLDSLCEAHDGWINLLPGIVEDEEDEEASSTSIFGLLFGSKGTPVTMATLMPPKASRIPQDGVTLGVMHPAGSKVMRTLDELGITLPAGWVVRQDHVRRGLVVRAAADAASADVVGWALRAAEALCRKEMTGQWRAVVYLP